MLVKPFTIFSVKELKGKVKLNQKTKAMKTLITKIKTRLKKWYAVLEVYANASSYAIHR